MASCAIIPERIGRTRRLTFRLQEVLLQRFQPVVVVPGPPVEQAEKCILYFSRQGAAAAIANGNMVKLAYRGYFCGCAGHEYFICIV